MRSFRPTVATLAIAPPHGNVSVAAPLSATVEELPLDFDDFLIDPLPDDFDAFLAADDDVSSTVPKGSTQKPTVDLTPPPVPRQRTNGDSEVVTPTAAPAVQPQEPKAEQAQPDRRQSHRETDLAEPERNSPTPSPDTPQHDTPRLFVVNLPHGSTHQSVKAQMHAQGLDAVKAVFVKESTRHGASGGSEVRTTAVIVLRAGSDPDKVMAAIDALDGASGKKLKAYTANGRLAPNPQNGKHPQQQELGTTPARGTAPRADANHRGGGRNDTARAAPQSQSRTSDRNHIQGNHRQRQTPSPPHRSTPAPPAASPVFAKAEAAPTPKLVPRKAAGTRRQPPPSGHVFEDASGEEER